MNDQSRIQKAQTAWLLGKALYDQAKAQWRRIDEKRSYSAVVSESDFIYPYLLNWLDTVTDGRHVRFRTTYSTFDRHYDGRGKNEVIIGGHKIAFALAAPSMGRKKDDDDTEDYGSDSLMELTSRNIKFTAKSEAAITALEEFLRDMHTKNKDKPAKPRQWYLGKWGWDYFKSPSRPLDTVYLPEGVKESMVDDLKKFIGHEAAYSAMGMPWHRGYLLYGDPGNGKSSLAQALATEFEFNLYDLPLSACTSDRDLAEKFNNIQSRSILLLEDIDIFTAATDRTQEKDRPTLAGLLNCLDGVNTPHGLIVVLSTNHRDQLDPALIRAGRVDMHIEFTAPSQYQADAMFQKVFGEELNVEMRSFKNMGELAEVFKTCIGEPEEARLRIKAG